MSNEHNENLLHKYFEEGLAKGLTEKQAIDYANNIFFSKGDNK